MEQETLFNILTGQYGEILETHAMWQCIAALGVKPFKDGNQWCFLYGDNIQEGICGFGDTIYKAAWNFYTSVKTEEAVKEESDDERTRKNLVALVKQSSNILEPKNQKRMLAYLEKKKEQKPIEWSEDFEQNIRILLHDKLTWRSEDGSISSIVVIDDKTLKDIVTGIWFYVGKEANKYPNKELKVEQKPAEWSEEDTRMLKHIISDLREFRDCETDEKLVSDYEDEISFLKSLRPQSHWKPSEEQMEALSDACVEAETFKMGNILESLYGDLKKL